MTRSIDDHEKGRSSQGGIFMETVLDIWVSGRPRTKGSLKGGRTGAGGERLADTPLSKKWRADVQDAVVVRIADPTDRIVKGKQAWQLRPGWPILGPVIVRLRFWFEPTNDRGDRYPTAHNFGDIDKLTRNVLDALETAGVFKEDCQVQSVWAEKGFCRRVGLKEPGVQIKVYRI